MADQQVKVILNGQDNTGAAFKSAEGNTKSLSTQVSDLSKVMGVGLLAAGTAATAFLYSSAKAAGEAEAAMARVTATLSAMGPAALENKDAIVKMSEAAVKLGFDDESAAESITKFYQRTGDLTKAQELNNIAMDLARAKTIDLDTATNLVNMTLSGNGKALAAYGISLKDSATPLEALGELHDKVRGQAEAFTGTFEGQSEVLGQVFNNLKETIGGALIEAITPFIKQLSDWASNPDVQKKITEIAKTMGDLAKTWIPILIDAAKILFNTFKFFYDLLVDIEVQILAVVDAITRFIAAAKNIGGNVLNKITGGLVGGRAAGGEVGMGSTYLVGENGPELFSPSSSGFIIPNGGGRGGGGTTIVINNPILLDDSMIEKIGQQIMRVVGRDLRI